MQAQKFRHHIEIQERVPSGDGYTWRKFARVWADKRPLSAREFMNADQVVSKAEGAFEFRFVAGINPKQRIVLKTQIFNIEGVLEDRGTGQHWLVIPYTRGTNAG